MNPFFFSEILAHNVIPHEMKILSYSISTIQVAVSAGIEWYTALISTLLLINFMYVHEEFKIKLHTPHLYLNIDTIHSN